jgi:opacity protein-like surface antigen
MTRAADGSDPLAKSFGEDNIHGGFEIGYTRRLGKLGKKKKWIYGIEAAVSWMNLCLRDTSGYSGNGVQDAYPYFPGTNPPNSPTANGQPYQGPFAPALTGPQFALISDTPITSAIVPITLQGHRQFDADIWGFRIGPFLERPIGKRCKVQFQGGLALALVSANASWSQNLTVNGVSDASFSGKGSGDDLLWGFYLGANFSYQISKRWTAVAGVQYQDLGTYRFATGDRDVELDMSEALFFQLGVSYSF